MASNDSVETGDTPRFAASPGMDEACKGPGRKRYLVAPVFRRVLKLRGLSQRSLAQSIGMNPGTITAWVKGAPITVEHLEIVAAALEVSPEKLTGEEERLTKQQSHLAQNALAVIEAWHAVLRRIANDPAFAVQEEEYLLREMSRSLPRLRNWGNAYARGESADLDGHRPNGA